MKVNLFTQLILEIANQFSKKRAAVWSFVLFTSFIGCSSYGGSSGPIPNRPDKLGDRLGVGVVSFEPAPPVRWQLPNGLLVLFREDDEIPVVSGQLYLPGGSLFEPEAKTGLASLVGGQMRDGSIQGVVPETFDELLDRLGARIESTYGGEYGRVGFSSLVEDFPQVFDYFAKVVRTPAFDEKRLALTKRLSLDAIKRRRDDPDTMASLSFSQLVYGADSQYGRIASAESISAISREDLLNFHQRFVRPNGAILAITGALSEEQARVAIDRAFGDWQRSTSAIPDAPQPGTGAPAGIYVLKRDFDQAVVFLGHLGPKRMRPEAYAMTILNRVFGSSGFESILFEEVRTQLGLAYVVDGEIAPGPVAGVFQVTVGTRNEQVVQALEKVDEILRRITTQQQSDERISAAKSAVEKGFVFNFASSSGIIGRAALLEKLGYPRDYDTKYLGNISKVSPEAALDAAKKFIWPDRYIVIIVGGVSPQEIAKGVKGRVPVYELDFDTAPRVVGPVN